MEDWCCCVVSFPCPFITRSVPRRLGHSARLQDPWTHDWTTIIRCERSDGCSVLKKGRNVCEVGGNSFLSRSVWLSSGNILCFISLLLPEKHPFLNFTCFPFKKSKRKLKCFGFCRFVGFDTIWVGYCIPLAFLIFLLLSITCAITLTQTISSWTFSCPHYPYHTHTLHTWLPACQLYAAFRFCSGLFHLVTHTWQLRNKAGPAGQRRNSEVTSAIRCHVRSLAPGLCGCRKSQSEATGEIDELDVGQWDASVGGGLGRELKGPLLWLQLKVKECK